MSMLTVIVMLCLFLVMFLIEKLWPANQLPKVNYWWLRVILINSSQAAIVLLTGKFIEPSFSNLNLPWAIATSWNPIIQTITGYILITFIYYWWHRLRHESEFFWRFCHQLHHSPRRMEVAMSFYKHPVEITINAMLSSAILYLLLGCTPEVAATVTILTGIAELFYHWNINTPVWLGPFFQRPESHRVHHQRNKHTNNYSDIPLWDIMFGTYQNPNKKIKRCGFSPAREQRFKDILGFQDVHSPSSEDQPSPHLQPTCIGCSKRWLCTSAKLGEASTTITDQQHENS